MCYFAAGVDDDCDKCAVILGRMAARGCSGATVHRLKNLAFTLRLDCENGDAEGYRRHMRRFVELLR